VQFLGRSLVLVGLVLVAVGLALHFGRELPLLGKLPGDLRFERGGVRFYLPLTSSILVSLLLSGLLWLLGRLR
jgi:hypothetical protein